MATRINYHVMCFAKECSERAKEVAKAHIYIYGAGPGAAPKATKPHIYIYIYIYIYIRRIPWRSPPENDAKQYKNKRRRPRRMGCKFYKILPNLAKSKQIHSNLN